jgi:hypothetical protein
MEVRMQTVRQIQLATLLGVALVCGCSSEPKDPFKEWGAAQNYSEYVPETAQSVARGVGTLTYTAPRNGVLYLIDTNALVNVKDVQKPTILVTGGIPKGTKIIFDPQESRVRAEGREGVKVRNVDPAHTHEFRFDPEGK